MLLSPAVLCASPEEGSCCGSHMKIIFNSLWLILTPRNIFYYVIFGKEEDENLPLIGLVGFMVVSVKYLVNE